MHFCPDVGTDFVAAVEAWWSSPIRRGSRSTWRSRELRDPAEADSREGAGAQSADTPRGWRRGADG